MTWFALLFSTVTTTLLAVLLYAMPAIIRPTLPLGVSVPQSHAQDPAIGQALRRYRVAIVAALLVCLVLAFLLAGTAPAAGVIAPVLLFVVLGAGAYIAARSGITRAKREGRWYDGVPVRLTAEVAVSQPATRTPLGWYIAAVIPLVIATGIGVAIYPSLPSPLPIHWGADGVANGYADKSVWSAFGVVLSGLGVVALMFGCSFLARRPPARRIASDTPETAAQRALLQQQLISGLLGQLAVVIALDMSVLAVIGWSVPNTAWAVTIPTVLLIVLMAAVIAVYFARYRRAISAPLVSANAGAPADAQAAARPVVDSTRPDAPDDDRYWKGGFLYFNRNDPALLVPKRFGIGWTVNLGHPVGIAIGVAILLLIVGSITLSILAPGSRH